MAAERTATGLSRFSASAVSFCAASSALPSVDVWAAFRRLRLDSERALVRAALGALPLFLGGRGPLLGLVLVVVALVVVIVIARAVAGVDGVVVLVVAVIVVLGAQHRPDGLAAAWSRRRFAAGVVVLCGPVGAGADVAGVGRVEVPGALTGLHRAVGPGGRPAHRRLAVGSTPRPEPPHQAEYGTARRAGAKPR